MNTIGKRIRNIRKRKGISQADLARAVGITAQLLYKYEMDIIVNIPSNIIENIANVLDIDPAYLMGWPTDGVRETEDNVSFPVIGEVAAGYDYIAQENWEGDTIEIPRSYLHGRPASDFMVLSVVGDSMYPEYRDGDRVLIKKCDTMPCSGRVGLFRYNGENATLKRIDYINGEDWVKLVPINPMYPPIKITGEDLTRCAVIGVPVCLIREIEE